MESHDESRHERIELHGAVLRSVGPGPRAIPPSSRDSPSRALAARGNTVLSGLVLRLAAAVLDAIHLVVGTK
jgi:hypothetical protein